MERLFGKSRRQCAYQAIDLFTRLSFSLIYHERAPRNTVDFLKRARKFFPFPVETFQFDNGTEFAYDLRPEVKKIHPAQAHLDRAGIGRAFSPVATPRMNGAVERLRRTWRREMERRRRWKKPSRMRKDDRRWLKHYDEERPRSGIGDIAPIDKLRSFTTDSTLTPDYSQCYFTV